MYRLFAFFILYSLAGNAAMAQNDSLKTKPSHTRVLIHEMPMNLETVEWQCDVYREIFSSKDVNTPMFHPLPEKNLFYQIFNLFIRSKIKGYAFDLNDFDEFSKNSVIDIKDVLENHNIFYTKKDDAYVVEDINIPYDEVMSYYIKEAVYYDLTNSCFRNKAVAICPVLRMDDDFGDIKGKYPMFWILVDDLLPHIRNLSVVPNSYNKVNVIQMSDYLARNLYSGEIFKVYNNRGLAFAQYCDNDSILEQEKNAAEKKLRDIRLKTYNTFYREKVTATINETDSIPNRKRKHNKKRR